MDTIIEKEAIETLERRAERRSDRRKAIMFGGAALAGIALTSKFAAAQAPAFTDADYLNFALNLEYLESQFYTLATAGVLINDSSLSSPLSIDSGDQSVKGGTVVTKAGVNAKITPVAFTTPVLQDYAGETATEERNHVTFLQTALKSAGAVSVAQPNIDLFNSFNALAVAAGIGATFDPFADETSFLLGAFIFEDVGVTAYTGAAPAITSAAILQAAASILAVEAYHAGSIRTRIYLAGTAAQDTSTKIAAARASLSASAGGAANDDIGVGTDSTGAATVVDANATAMTTSRTPAQVLAITKAFFPNGVTGNIK